MKPKNPLGKPLKIMDLSTMKLIDKKDSSNLIIGIMFGIIILSIIIGIMELIK